MADMTERVMDDIAYGRAALKKMGDVSENFRIHTAGWIGGAEPSMWHGMQVTGSEFRPAKTGPNKGRLTIMVKESSRTVYVSKAEINAER